MASTHARNWAAPSARGACDSIRRYADETFALEGGITFIDGENNAGKTTILYAIEYALFGRVGGFTTQTALLHPGERGLGVELCFTGRDGLRYRLQRIHARPPRARTQVVGHFTLKRQAEPDGPEQYVLSSDFGDTQEALAIVTSQVLGMTPRIFDVAVHLRQGRIAGILAGAPELDNVLGVTAAVIAAEEMRALALENEKEAATLPQLLDAQARASLDVETSKGEVLAFEREEAERLAACASLDAQKGLLEERAAALAPVRAQAEAVSRGFMGWERTEADVARHEAALEQLVTRVGTVSALEAKVEASARDVAAASARQADAAATEREVADRRRAIRADFGDPILSANPVPGMSRVTAFRYQTRPRWAVKLLREVEAAQGRRSWRLRGCVRRQGIVVALPYGAIRSIGTGRLTTSAV